MKSETLSWKTITNELGFAKKLFNETMISYYSIKHLKRKNSLLLANKLIENTQSLQC